MDSEVESLRRDVNGINRETAKNLRHDTDYKKRINSINDSNKRQKEIEKIYIEELEANGIRVHALESDPEQLQYTVLCSRDGVERKTKFVFKYEDFFEYEQDKKIAFIKSMVIKSIITTLLSSVFFTIFGNLKISKLFTLFSSGYDRAQESSEKENRDSTTSETAEISDMSEEKELYCDTFYRMLFPKEANDTILVQTDDVNYNLTMRFTTNDELGDKMDFTKGNTVTVTHDTADEIHDIDWFINEYWPGNNVLTQAIAEEKDNNVSIDLAQKWDEAVRGCGTSLNWSAIQIETILQNINGSKDWTPNLRKAVIDFLARYMALLDMKKESILTHKTSYDYIGEEPYAAGGRHSDPTNLQDEEKLQEYIDELWEKAQEYENDSNFPTWNEFVKYAKSRRVQEVQKNINSESEEEYLDMDKKQKEVESICYKYCREQIGLDKEYIAGILGQINAVSAFDCDYSEGNRFGLFGFSNNQYNDLKNYAEENGKDYSDAQTQMEFFHKMILDKAAYKITDTRSYPIDFENLVFWSASEAGYWIERWGLQNENISEKLEEKIRQYSEIEYKYYEEIQNREVVGYFSNRNYKCAYTDKRTLYSISRPKITGAVQRYTATAKSNEELIKSIAKMLDEPEEETKKWINGLGLNIYDQNTLLGVTNERLTGKNPHQDYSRG